MANHSRNRRENRPALLTIPPPDHLAAIRSPAKMPVDTAAALTGASARTVAGWRRHGIPPGSHLYTLQSVAFGLLPHPAWHEYTLAPDGTLNHWTGTRSGSGFRPAMIAFYEATAQENRLLHAELRKARALIDTLKAPPARWPPDLAANDADASQLPLSFFGQ